MSLEAGVDKLQYLNKDIFEPLDARLIHIPRGKKGWNAFVERSHQTDDTVSGEKNCSPVSKHTLADTFSMTMNLQSTSRI